MEIMEKVEHVVSKETYIGMKAFEKELARTRKEDKQGFKAWMPRFQKYLIALNEYQWKGGNKPDPVESDPTRITKAQARAFYILYGFVKGKNYKDVERDPLVMESYWSPAYDVRTGIAKWAQLFNLPTNEVQEYLKDTPFVSK